MRAGKRGDRRLAESVARRQELFQTRTALEVTYATRAAERLRRSGIKRLREVLALEEQMQEEALGSGQTHDLHVAIAETIIAGDPALAQHRMRRRLEAVAAWSPSPHRTAFQPIEQGAKR